MTKITITCEDGPVQEINATSFAINAVCPDKDGIVTAAETNDTAENVTYLIASLLAGFTDLANQAVEVGMVVDKTVDEFVAELAEIADRMLKIGVEDAE